MDLNNVSLIGRLTKDVEVKMTNTGKTVGRFSIAVNRMDGKADFINCIAWGKTVEAMNTYCSKGSRVCVTGRIQTGQYQNQQGKTIYTTDVVVNQVQFLESKKEQAQEVPEVPTNEYFGEPLKIEDEDLPF